MKHIVNKDSFLDIFHYLLDLALITRMRNYDTIMSEEDLTLKSFEWLDDRYKVAIPYIMLSNDF